jgi:hypothetical protein
MRTVIFNLVLVASIVASWPLRGAESDVAGVGAQVVASAHPRVVLTSQGKRVMLDFSLENRSSRTIKIAKSLAYSDCYVLTRALHVVGEDGKEVVYIGKMATSGAGAFPTVEKSDDEAYDVLKPGRKLVVHDVDISAAYAFPKGPAVFSVFWDGGVFELGGGWIGLRSREEVLRYEPISVGTAEKHGSGIEKVTPSRKALTVQCKVDGDGR